MTGHPLDALGSPRAEASQQFTPREIVSELDRFIVGQSDAKRAVAIALRNRWRRRQVPPPLRDEIAPKNILLMGPTGCGKTEIARRLARLARAPFVKVEATKFTEVGYVGRDVDSMVRDLVEVSAKMVRDEALLEVKERGAEAAEERVLDALLPRPAPARAGGLFGGVPFDQTQAPAPGPTSRDDAARERMRQMLKAGELDDRDIEVDVAAGSSAPTLQMFSQPGMEEMTHGLQEALSQAFGGQKRRRRKLKVKDAMEVLAADEAQKLIDQDAVNREAVVRAEQSGIIFIDEIDKIASGSRGQGPEVSREGVQRDILPIIEGSTVSTKYGQVKTDHVLFICAGAFHMSKPSDLIPELQGRLPIRVELKPLSSADFVRILKETEASLIRQYQALLATEGVQLTFADDSLDEIARVAAAVNEQQENIGARRLATVLERLLEEESFDAADRRGTTVLVDKSFVERKLAPILKREDLSRYIL